MEDHVAALVHLIGADGLSDISMETAGRAAAFPSNSSIPV